MHESHKYDGKSPMAHLCLHNVPMTQYLKNENVLVQILPNSLTRLTPTSYTQLDLTKLKSWDDRAITFIIHQKYNVDITSINVSCRECSRKATQVSRNMPREGERLHLR